MSGTLVASLVKDGASATNNLALDSSGNVTVGNNLTVSGTGNTSFSGNVGIGTSSPVNNLAINGNGISLLPTYATYLVNSYYNAGWKYGANGIAWGIGNNFGGVTNGVTIAVATSNAGGAGAALTWNPAFNIDSSGNVGIGTTSPVTKLNLQNGTLSIQNGTGALPASGYGWEIYNVSTTINYLQSYNRTSSAYMNSVYNALSHQMYISGAEAARIDTSGNLLVGATATVWGERLLARPTDSSTTNPALGIYSANASYATSLMFAQTESASGTSWQFFNGRSSGGSQRVIIYGNGNIVNVNNSYGVLSDISLKENVNDATPKLDDLLKVRIVNYNLKSDPDHKQIGVIAQELEQVFPALVESDNDGIKSVKSSVFVPILIKALQEAVAKITALEDRITKLESVK